jgi:hypothetical protein
MTHKKFMYLCASDLREWLDNSDKFYDRITVDLYEMELSRLASERRFNIRVGFGIGQELPTGSIPGTNLRGVRVDTGYPYWTIQQYSLQCSVYFGDETQNDEGNEEYLIDLADELTAWTKDFATRVGALSDGYCPAFVWNGHTKANRLGNIAYLNASILAQRQTQR